MDATTISEIWSLLIPRMFLYIYLRRKHERKKAIQALLFPLRLFYMLYQKQGIGYCQTSQKTQQPVVFFLWINRNMFYTKCTQFHCF
jgi:hypothetical protein